MSIKSNPLVITHSAKIDQNGGAVTVAQVGASVTVQPGSAQQMSISLSAAQRQFDEVLRPNYAFTSHGVLLSVTPSEMADNGELTVQLPVQGAYDPKRTLVGVMTKSGQVLSLQNEQLSSDGLSVSASLTKPILSALHDPAAATKPLELMAFTANPAPMTASATLVSGAYLWKDNTFIQPVPNMAGNRVAICVHGLDSQLSDVTLLAGYLAGLNVSGASMYDAVIGFQYSSTIGLAIIGEAMAQAIYPIIAGATSIDLIAHSMGNLVARYAMETTSLPQRLGPQVRRYVSLAGPHQGIPFADLSLVKSFYFDLNLPNLPCINDMLTYGANGHSDTSFLPALNVKTDGPDYDTAEYFTLSGTKWETYDEPFGTAVQALYFAADPFDKNQREEDGLVATYSAQTSLLQKLSKSWKPGPKLSINHGQFVTDDISFNQVGAWLQAP